MQSTSARPETAVWRTERPSSLQSRVPEHTGHFGEDMQRADQNVRPFDNLLQEPASESILASSRPDQDVGVQDNPHYERRPRRRSTASSISASSSSRGAARADSSMTLRVSESRRAAA